MKVNFKSKKTEEQWQASIDEFWIKVTPLWFDWLQWILVLGVISFLAKETDNKILIGVSGFSYLAFFFYLQSLFYSIEFKGFPIIQSKRGQRIISLIVSGVLSYAIWYLLFSLISQIQGKV